MSNTEPTIAHEFVTHRVMSNGDLHVKDVRNFAVVVAAHRLSVRLYLRTGVKASSNFPTVERLREFYGVPSSVRTYKDIFEVIENVHSFIEERATAA